MKRSPLKPGTKVYIDEENRRECRRLYPEIGDCERCMDAPATDRHHINGDTGNNHRSNVAFLCRKCHMEQDGRLERLVTQIKARKGTRLKPDIICANCGVQTRNYGHMLCHACAQYQWNNAAPRPLQKPLPPEQCSICGKCLVGVGSQRRVGKQCRNCYMQRWRAGQ